MHDFPLDKSTHTLVFDKPVMDQTGIEPGSGTRCTLIVSRNH